MMEITARVLGRVLFSVGVGAVCAAGLASGACAVGVTPECMVHCFEYTVEFDVPTECKDSEGQGLKISFTGSSPDGYRGRFCSNAGIPVADTAEAIKRLRDGESLSYLSAQLQANYTDVVNLIRADMEAQCITAAPGQCVNEVQVCDGIGADAYEALIVDETCILEPGGVEPYQLAPLESCNFTPIFYGFATEGAEPGEFCTGTDGGATSGTSDGADETTAAESGPFGDIDDLVSCSPQTSCEVERELLTNIEANFDVFYDEEVTLTIVDSSVQCGPGAKIGGLNSGEDAKELADAFDLRNGDIIRSAEGISIQSLQDAIDVVVSLSVDPSTTMVLRRIDASNPASCDTLTYDIDVL